MRVVLVRTLGGVWASVRTLEDVDILVLQKYKRMSGIRIEWLDVYTPHRKWPGSNKAIPRSMSNATSVCIRNLATLERHVAL
jgi:hypothetical protein